MKILEISRSFYPSIGGLEKFVADRLKLYDEIGIKHKLLTTNYNTGKFDYKLRQDKVTYLKQYTPYNFVFSLKKTLLNFEYDIISVNQIGNHLSDYSLFFGIKNKIKTILTPHFYFHTNKYLIFKYLHKISLSSYLLKKIDLIICFTEYEKNFYINNFNIDERKIIIIPHYFDLKQDYGEPIYKPFIFYLGRISKNKRVDLLIKAYDNLKNYPYELYLTLSESDLNESQMKIIRNNNKIKLIGQISDSEKYKLLNQTSALVLPTEYEAFGIVLFEASYFNKPILCSKLRIFEEILNNNGVLYFENNIESLTNTLLKFSKLNQEEIKNIGYFNKLNFSKYTFDSILKKYQNLFNKLSN